MNKDFIEIVKAAQMGDNRAFEALYNMTKDSAYFIALSITKNEQDAMDIMQDSYIKAFESISTLNSPELFDNWLGRIVANTSKNYITKKKPLLFAEISSDVLGEWNEEEFKKDYLPHESVDTKETSRLLMEIINGLSEDKRLCVLMYYYQDMSVKEIAEALELPVSNIKYKLLSARAEIKKGVEDLEKRGTKLYGVFPFALFPAQFKNIETEFLKAHSSPAYSSLNFSAQAVGQPVNSQTVNSQAMGQPMASQVHSVGSQAVSAVAKKGFFTTLAGKITAVSLGAVLIGGGITATVVATKDDSSGEKLTAEDILSSTEPTYSDRVQEALKNPRNEFTSPDGLYECKITSYENDEVMITAYNEPDTMTELVVPSTINDYTVTAIEGNTFLGLENTSSITLPDTITELHLSAFSDSNYIVYDESDIRNLNPSLKEVVLPNSITSIPGNCFRGCSSLEKITFPQNLESIGYSAFHDCTLLESIELPETLVTIGPSSFGGCESITEVYIPKSVTQLYNGAFQRCTSLEKVYLDEEIQLEEEEFCLKGIFVVGNPSIKEIHLPDDYTGRIDFLEFYRYNSEDNSYTPRYEGGKGLEGLTDITFYGKSGSNFEEIITSCGLKFVATDEEQTD